jgi:hypothetical protein
MSDLQLSLLVIGVVVVGAVGLYNWLQERGLRRRLQKAFGDAPDDVLLKAEAGPVRVEGRLEPQLARAESPARGELARGEGRTAAAAPAAAAPDFDEFLDYVAEIDADAPIADAVIGELTSKIASCGKPTRITGFDPHRGVWEEVVRGAAGRNTKLRLALQLVNRSGPINAAQLAAFCDAIRQCAERIPAPASCQDATAALKVARDIDAICADFDVAVGVNIIAREGRSFPGTRIRALAEAAGFKLEPDGVFHYRNEHRQTLFTLDNHEPAPFLPESIKGLTTNGITLLLDVPRVADGIGALERMLQIASALTASLGGSLVDDNRATLSEAGIVRIKEQVRSIHAAMAARGMAAGGARALRLFS